MRHGNHGFALGFELRQQGFVEITPKLRVLLGFVKDVDGGGLPGWHKQEAGVIVEASHSALQHGLNGL